MITEELLDLALRLKAAADARMDRTLNSINASWAAAWDEMSDEWGAAIDELAAVAGAEGQWPTRAQIVRSQRAQKALEASQAALQQLSGALPGDVAADLADVVSMARDHQLAMIRGQLPETPADFIDIRRNYDARALASIINRTTQQVTSLALPLSDEATAAMKSALIRGVAIGENPRDTARAMMKKVNGQFEGGRRRAENIARTEMMDAYRASAKRTDDELAHLVKGWEWRSALNDRTCLACLGMNGREFPLDQPGPEGHPSCRCTRVPVLKKFSDLGFGDVPEPVSPNGPPLNGPDWLEQQDSATQLKIMGRKRYDAWKAGDFPPEQWAVRRENPAWRPSYGVGDPGGPALAPNAPGSQTGISGLQTDSLTRSRYDEVFDQFEGSVLDNEAAYQKDFEAELKQAMANGKLGEFSEKYPVGHKSPKGSWDSYKGWSSVNQKLRADDLLAEDWQEIYALDAVFDQSGITLTKAHTFTRGVDGDTAQVLKGSWKPGNVIADPAFVSTTADDTGRTVSSFMGGDTRGMEISYEVPAGTRVILGEDREYEVILPRGGVYEVVRVEPNEVFLRMVP